MTTLFKRVIHFPVYKTKKSKQILSLNNMSKWFRYSKTKLKNDYKSILLDLYLPEPPEKPYHEVYIHYRVLRHNKIRIDSMNVVPWSDKWLVDTLVEMGWLVDDDKVHHVIEPAEFREGINETLLQIEVGIK